MNGDRPPALAVMIFLLMTTLGCSGLWFLGHDSSLELCPETLEVRSVWRLKPRLHSVRLEVELARVNGAPRPLPIRAELVEHGVIERGVSERGSAGKTAWHGVAGSLPGQTSWQGAAKGLYRELTGDRGVRLLEWTRACPDLAREVWRSVLERAKADPELAAALLTFAVRCKSRTEWQRWKAFALSCR